MAWYCGGVVLWWRGIVVTWRSVTGVPWNFDGVVVC